MSIGHVIITTEDGGEENKTKQKPQKNPNTKNSKLHKKTYLLQTFQPVTVFLLLQGQRKQLNIHNALKPAM